MIAKRVAVAGTLLGAALAACSSDEPTQVIVAVTAEPGVRSRTERLRVVVKGRAHDQDEEARTAVDETVMLPEQWPVRLAISPKDADAERIYEVVVTALDEARQELTSARLISGYVPNETRYVELRLEDACIGVRCDEQLTCRAQKCVDAKLDAHSFASHLEDAVQPQGDGGTPPLDAGGSGGPDGGNTAGMGGEGGDGGDGGAAGGSGDGGGNGGAAGGSGDGGGPDAGMPCVPEPAEDCFNGADDDCNGDTDCADEACRPVATCVPGGPRVGVLIDADADCPQGYGAASETVHRGLQGGGCAGCSCSASPTSCEADVFYYTSQSDCQTDVYMPYSGGVSGGVATFTCTPEPIAGGNVGGWRVGEMRATPGTCSASGSPAPEPASWSETRKLCEADQTGGGCDEGFTCAPLPRAGARACGEGESEDCALSAETWYTDFEDTRTCGTCSCIGSGGDCGSVHVRLGSDWGCDVETSLLVPGQKDCSANPYSPPVILVGAPTDRTCVPTVSASGALTPVGRLDLCCQP